MLLGNKLVSLFGKITKENDPTIILNLNTNTYLAGFPGLKLSLGILILIQISFNTFEENKQIETNKSFPFSY